ncbi:MAG: glutathione binding-like protein, partial [Rhodospirillales bacterium]|nr:glutathione binding-like protein [Rhodospirillales bacterium]
LDEDAVGNSRAKLSRAFQNMDDTLGAHSWLAGQSYSLADIAAAPVVDRVQRLGMEDLWGELGNLKDWIERLESRPAYAAARPRGEFRLPAPIPAA